MRRAWRQAPAVHFAAAGFYHSDVTRFKSQIGPERFARFERQRDDAIQRARDGRLTDYEKALEAI